MRYLLCLSLLAAPAFSVACSNANTWYEQAECRNQQIASEKQALDQAVSAYSATLSPADKELFKKAQTAWKSYADATCKLSAAPVAKGSMYGAYLSSCEINLSKQRRQMLEYQTTCEKSSERTDCLEQFKPGSPAKPVTATTTTSPKASKEDVDRLTTYGAALGKGIACKANGVDEASFGVYTFNNSEFIARFDHDDVFIILGDSISNWAREVYFNTSEYNVSAFEEDCYSLFSVRYKEPVENEFPNIYLPYFQE